MTNEELREAAEVMRRAANGEPVQWKARNSLHGAWNDCGSKDPLWVWDTDTYRIKPQQPRELYAIYDRTTGVFMGAHPNPFGGTAVNTIKFREVIE